MFLCVAVGLSGSFPAMNVAVYSALYELGVEPIIISSTAASQWGANDPNFTWLDMEAVLRKADVFPVECVARGYLIGSGWKDYQAEQSTSGVPLRPVQKVPRELQEARGLPGPGLPE